jgi:hypothetical protein
VLGQHCASTGKHRKQGAERRRRTVEMVDARTFVTHRLTLDAHEAGMLPAGRYMAMCGREILPAVMADSGSKLCRVCTPSVIPAQRGGGRKWKAQAGLYGR